MHRSKWLLLTGLLPVALVVGCSSTPSGSAAAPTLPPAVSSTAAAVSSTAVAVSSTASTAAPVQITNATLGASDATITVHSVGSQPVSLSGWTLMIGATAVQLPSSATVPAGQNLVLHTAAGTSTGTDVYLGQNTQAIASSLQPGAKVALQNPSGSTIASFNVPNG